VDKFPSRGLIIKKKWLDLILSGDKIWEIRSTNTSLIGKKIALIESGSGLIKGTTYIIGTYPFTVQLWRAFPACHQIPRWSDVRYSDPWIWCLNDTVTLPEPIPYNHPSGAVIWVDLTNPKTLTRR
jgi:hypothetical protein